MKTFIFDTFNKYRRFSESLDVETILCNRTWFVFNNSGEREVYIFQEKGRLKISLNGRVTHGTWEYIPANKSLIISGNEQSYMVHTAYVDNILFALQIDGTNEYTFLIDENNKQNFQPQSYNDIKQYFQIKEQKVLQKEKSEQLERERLLAQKKEEERQEKERIKAELINRAKDIKHPVIYLIIGIIISCVSAIMLVIFLREPRENIVDTNITACTSQKESYTQEQLYEKMSSGVLLVQNTYYYTVHNEKCGSFYMLTTKNGYTCHKYDYQTKDSIEANYSNRLYGTGFFLNNKKTIVTNSHVINPKIDTIQLCNSIEAHLINEIEEYTKMIETAMEFKSYCINKLSNNGSLSNSEKEFFNICNRLIQNQPKKSAKLLKELQELQDEDFKKNYEIRIHAQIGVALNGIKISSNEDFGSVVVAKDVPNYDLGIIVPFYVTSYMFRISDKNYENRYVFELSNETNKSNEELKLYMIGFNKGPDLALTNEGIKAQITQGNISQNTDSIKIMYSIPALPGSSGSPVVNQYGELVAVNFAGISSTQGFNYGIKAERLKEILNDANIQKTIETVNRE